MENWKKMQIIKNKIDDINMIDLLKENWNIFQNDLDSLEYESWEEFNFALNSWIYENYLESFFKRNHIEIDFIEFDELLNELLDNNFEIKEIEN